MADSGSINYMRQFAANRDTACTVNEENGIEYLNVGRPTQLANLVAFCKARQRRIYLRGQNSLHQSVLPDLFRGPGNNQARWQAYRAFLRRLPTGVKGTRFTRRNFGAVLQHYGFRTSWLDVVDNLHTAIWFALNERKLVNGQYTYRPTECPAGWILLISAPRDVRHQDLRETQSSRNSRCHAQQGWSLAMQPDDQADFHQDQDFSRYVVGTVRIPNSDEWLLTGFMGSQRYLFPNDEMDDTYKQLKSPQVAQLAAAIEAEHRLNPNSLGRIALYADAHVLP